MDTPAGWYDDGSGRQRWWDGQRWTDQYADAQPPTVPPVPEATSSPLPEPGIASPSASEAAPAAPFAAATGTSPQSSGAAKGWGIAALITGIIAFLPASHRAALYRVEA